MNTVLINKIISESQDVQSFKWLSDNVIEISRKEISGFRAAILSKSVVTTEDVSPLLTQGVAVIVNFPKIGMWSGDAIDVCEKNDIAWGRFGVLLRAFGMDDPQNSVDPEINFSRRALSQHSKVADLGFILDHLLKIRHETGKVLRVALVYEYDLSGDDVRRARERLGKFDFILKTNPNGSILKDAHSAAESIGAKVYPIGDLMRHLAKLNDN
ncbi:hypothetical protein [Mesorhizobium sp. M7A.F.Ce.TU.012.03.2.1]|uniref:hypothetical protein n=1 Tax=Mesorhizobium sp. M7A.F.Ce.TU.012.03.2.1 TaxID=2493681 RepID=UPI000FDBF35E|nr:hypothetical protein [Mesorhizobium sp. M7A.F.Ce.TU.012.03.2.1]AZV21000.1 hypothetical protein EJ079_19170 [Mesorhizobium sp. M7A.F.Ce.TU.012.03.2.1]